MMGRKRTRPERIPKEYTKKQKESVVKNYRKLTVSDIQNISNRLLYKKMDKNELVRLIRKTAEYSKKRRKRFLEAQSKNPDMPMPSVYRESGTSSYKSWVDYNFDVDETKTRNKLIKQFIEEAKFLSTKTSTVSGWENTIKDFLGRVLKTTSNKVINVELPKLTRQNYKDLWEIYNKIEQLSSSAEVYGGSQKVIDYIYQHMRDKDYMGMSVDEIAKEMNSKLSGIESEIELREQESESEDIDYVGIRSERNKRRTSISSPERYK